MAVCVQQTVKLSKRLFIVRRGGQHRYPFDDSVKEATGSSTLTLVMASMSCQGPGPRDQSGVGTASPGSVSGLRWPALAESTIEAE